MRAVVVGAGAVGARAARQLIALGALDELVIVETDADRARAVTESLGGLVPALSTAPTLEPHAGDVVLLAAPGSPRPHAETALEAGADVVSVADAPDDVRSLLDLDAEARERRRHVVVGAGFSPGLSCVLAARAAAGFDEVEEILVARVGKGGPACARQYRSALRGATADWLDGHWDHNHRGSGRQLCWFPAPVRAIDCYRASTPEALLLVPAFPGVHRVSVRVGASRGDRLAARLPALHRPSPDGTVGALRVEVRGTRGGSRDERVLGAVDHPAVAAGLVCGLAARWVLDSRMSRTGAGGLAEMVEPVPFLAALAERGVKAATFEGAAAGPA